MAKVQSRKTVSVPGDVHDRFQIWCDRRAMPMSQAFEALIERCIAGDIDVGPVLTSKQVATRTVQRRWKNGAYEGRSTRSRGAAAPYVFGAMGGDR